jgi:hypothetical protein
MRNLSGLTNHEGRSTPTWESQGSGLRPSKVCPRHNSGLGRLLAGNKESRSNRVSAYKWLMLSSTKARSSTLSNLSKSMFKDEIAEAEQEVDSWWLHIVTQTKALLANQSESFVVAQTTALGPREQMSKPNSKVRPNCRGAFSRNGKYSRHFAIAPNGQKRSGCDLSQAVKARVLASAQGLHSQERCQGQGCLRATRERDRGWRNTGRRRVERNRLLKFLDCLVPLSGLVEFPAEALCGLATCVHLKERLSRVD